MAGDLSVGDTVVTRSGKPQPITRIDHLTITQRQLQDDPSLCPIRFDAGALPGMPDDPATLVSPDCLIMSDTGQTDAKPSDFRHFPARAYCDGGMVRRVIPDEGLHYIRLHFAATQEICVGGIWVEMRAEDLCGAETSGQPSAQVFELWTNRPQHA